MKRKKNKHLKIYVLGVHKSATNIAILGEMGLYPLSLKALKSSVGYWLIY
jgi:hypothetical protein